MQDLDQARARRWWQTGRKVGSRTRAAAFLEDVGFALLYPKSGLALPTLWGAVTDRPVSDLPHEWGPDAERVWAWKDELPRRGLAWYGRFLHGHPSFLSPAVLADLYPRSGRPEDFDETELSPDARRIARILLRSGPQPTSALREALGVEGRRGGDAFARAVTELGRALVVTHHGTEDEGAGWPSAVLELTARAFPIQRRRDPDAARLRAARTFLTTVLVARPYQLGNAFGWGADGARAALESLTGRGEAEREGPAYVAVTDVRSGSRRRSAPPRRSPRTR